MVFDTVRSLRFVVDVNVNAVLDPGCYGGARLTSAVALLLTELGDTSWRRVRLSTT